MNIWEMVIVVAFIVVTLYLAATTAISWLNDRHTRRLQQERAASLARVQWATDRASEQMLQTAREAMLPGWPPE